MIKLVICVYFRAPLGGLQDNILATALSASAAGWQVTILCPEGLFLSDHVLASGINGLGTNFSNPSKRAMQVLCEADIIHAHPGPSRQLALAAKLKSGSPLFFTVHGAWFDNVPQYAEHLAALICVSPSVCEALTSLCPDHALRPVFIPNGIDCNHFPLHIFEACEPGHVVVASRYDVDKRLVVDTLIGLWRVQSSRDIAPLHYTVAGTGTLLPEMLRVAEELSIPVTFVGWQLPAGLSALFARAAVVIASGRAAMESLACGRPTLALASVGAVEVFSEAQLEQATYCNFGGYGAAAPAAPEVLLDRILACQEHTNAAFSRRAAEYIRQHHDNESVNALLLKLYDEMLSSKANAD